MTIPPPNDADNIVQIERYRADELFDPWQEFVVPRFPLETLPDAVAHFVTTHADLMGADPSGLAMAVLCAFSAAPGSSALLRMMQNSTWLVSPRLWVLLVGRPSTLKTPVIKAAIGPLEVHQAGLWRAHMDAVREHKAAGGKDADAPKKPLRFIITDITVEACGELLGAQDRGVLVKRDELSGFIGSMDQYKDRGNVGADRAFWLQAYDGGAYAIDRVKRNEARHVNNLSVSLIGGIQPARLAEIKGLSSDGLLQRFTPVMLREATFPEDKPGDGSALADYRRLTMELVAARPMTLTMDADALALAEQTRRRIFDIEQAGRGLAAGFEAFAGKLKGTFGSIALILHMIRNGRVNESRHVCVDTIERASRITLDFVLPHAFEFYKVSEGASDGDIFQKVASFIITSGKRRIVPSDLTTNVAAFRGLSTNDIASRLSPMVATGWLEPEGPTPTPKAYAVNPQVEKQFAERRAAEEQRKQALAALMRSPRRPAATYS